MGLGFKVSLLGDGGGGVGFKFLQRLRWLQSNPRSSGFERAIVCTRNYMSPVVGGYIMAADL